jgi:MFS family permease
MLPMLIASAVAALVSGYLSDRWGHRRKVFIYASGVAMVAVCVGLMVIRSLWIGLGISVLFGAGYGTYLAVDFAIVMDVLPSKDDVARDVSLWHLALVLPQIFATPVAGLMLDRFEEIGDAHAIHCLGYMVIWGIAAVYFSLGSGFIGRVRGIR